MNIKVTKVFFDINKVAYDKVGLHDFYYKKNRHRMCLGSRTSDGWYTGNCQIKVVCYDPTEYYRALLGGFSVFT